MPGKLILLENVNGLTDNEVSLLRQRFGKNIYLPERPHRVRQVLKEIATEPMLILLVIASLLYFILGQRAEGFMMLAAIILVSAIAFFQQTRSEKALDALKELTEPQVSVIRNGAIKTVSIEELVPGDLIRLEEGSKVPADGLIIQSNDLSVNESILTGESLPVEKNSKENSNSLFQGTAINTGKCIVEVTATGDQTTLAKLGKSVIAYNPGKTLLQRQVSRFVKRLAIFGLIAFLVILAFNYLKTGSFSQSLLFGLTLAMAAIPEEIPVAISSFMALGAFQMSKLGIITRQPQTIESLGAVSVICLDKTGTITENKMQVKILYDFGMDTTMDLEQGTNKEATRLLFYAMLSSEADPYDSMEKAILEAYRTHSTAADAVHGKMVYEYPLEGRPPMMTHVFEYKDKKLAAAKGSAERIIRVCRLEEKQSEKIMARVHELSGMGFRVLGVASCFHNEPTMPASQDEFKWKFEGLISFYDPPKKGIDEVFRQFYAAGMRVKLLTGDFPETAITIARQAGMIGLFKYHTGEEVMALQGEDLRKAVQSVDLFARMFPDAKVRVIEALKDNGEIIAMTGDGVNDGPALKAAHIGIAMGKKGTAIAREAADLILTDDNPVSIVEAIGQGRKIYNNMRKAVRYIISIHIPIILTAAIPLILNWEYPNIFSPIHIIFLELIMGPTCSIFFEREPVEPHIMKAAPRKKEANLFKKDELLITIIQGLMITGGVLTLYSIYMRLNYSIEQTRMIVFTTLLVCNILLTFVNRSFTDGLNKTIFYKNNLAKWILLISITYLAILHFWNPARALFQVDPISLPIFLICVGTSLVSVLWFEGYKIVFHRRSSKAKE